MSASSWITYGPQANWSDPSQRKSRNYFVEERSRIFIVKYVDLPKSTSNATAEITSIPSVSEDDFLDLWYEGDLSEFEHVVQGYKPEGRGSYKVTFKELNDVVRRLEHLALHKTVVLKNAAGKKLSVEMLKPRVPLKTVTLRPVPISLFIFSNFRSKFSHFRVKKGRCL